MVTTNYPSFSVQQRPFGCSMTWQYFEGYSNVSDYCR